MWWYCRRDAVSDRIYLGSHTAHPVGEQFTNQCGRFPTKVSFGVSSIQLYELRGTRHANTGEDLTSSLHEENWSSTATIILLFIAVHVCFCPLFLFPPGRQPVAGTVHICSVSYLKFVSSVLYSLWPIRCGLIVFAYSQKLYGMNYSLDVLFTSVFRTSKHRSNLWFFHSLNFDIACFF